MPSSQGLMGAEKTSQFLSCCRLMTKIATNNTTPARSTIGTDKPINAIEGPGTSSKAAATRMAPRRPMLRGARSCPAIPAAKQVIPSIAIPSDGSMFSQCADVPSADSIKSSGR